MNENWRTLLWADPDEQDEMSMPRQSRIAFDRSYYALENESFVYRNDQISGGIDTLKRTYLDDMIRSGLLYTNTFKQQLAFIKQLRTLGKDISFCDQIIAAMAASGVAGQVDHCPGLYFFLKLRDCVRMQYSKAADAKTPALRLQLTAITRTRIENLPLGAFWPDLLPQEGASGARHVVPHLWSNPNLPNVPPHKIQIWFGQWIDLPDLDIEELRRDVEAANLERILFPCGDGALQE